MLCPYRRRALRRQAVAAVGAAAAATAGRQLLGGSALVNPGAGQASGLRVAGPLSGAGLSTRGPRPFAATAGAGEDTATGSAATIAETKAAGKTQVATFAMG